MNKIVEFDFSRFDKKKSFSLHNSFVSDKGDHIYLLVFKKPWNSHQQWSRNLPITPKLMHSSTDVISINFEENYQNLLIKIEKFWYKHFPCTGMGLFNKEEIFKILSDLPFFKGVLGCIGAGVGLFLVPQWLGAWATLQYYQWTHPDCAKYTNVSHPLLER